MRYFSTQCIELPFYVLVMCSHSSQRKSTERFCLIMKSIRAETRSSSQGNLPQTPATWTQPRLVVHGFIRCHCIGVCFQYCHWCSRSCVFILQRLTEPGRETHMAKTFGHKLLVCVVFCGIVVLWIVAASELDWQIERPLMLDQNVTMDVSRNFFTFGWLMVSKLHQAMDF